MENSYLTEKVLNKLHIRYHCMKCKQGVLYFAMLRNGITFDLFLGGEGFIRLWRFIDSVRLSDCQDICFENKKDRDNSMGIHFTEEGDLEFYMNLRVELCSSDIEKCLQEQIIYFIDTVRRLDMQCLGISQNGV